MYERFAALLLLVQICARVKMDRFHALFGWLACQSWNSPHVDPNTRELTAFLFSSREKTHTEITSQLLVNATRQPLLPANFWPSAEEPLPPAVGQREKKRAMNRHFHSPQIVRHVVPLTKQMSDLFWRPIGPLLVQRTLATDELRVCFNTDMFPSV